MSRDDYFNVWTETQRSLGYSQGVKVGPTVHVSGTAALDEEFKPVSPGDLGAQMRPFPASTTVEVQRLFAPGLMIEIEVTAHTS